jgi:hypothetical protein
MTYSLKQGLRLDRLAHKVFLHLLKSLLRISNLNLHSGYVLRLHREIKGLYLCRPCPVQSNVHLSILCWNRPYALEVFLFLDKWQIQIFVTIVSFYNASVKAGLFIMITNIVNILVNALIRQIEAQGQRLIRLFKNCWKLLHVEDLRGTLLQFCRFVWFIFLVLTRGVLLSILQYALVFLSILTILFAFYLIIDF